MLHKLQTATWNSKKLITYALLLILFSHACDNPPTGLQSINQTTPGAVNPGETPNYGTDIDSQKSNSEHFTTLSSLKKIDDYPFYTMHYTGPYIQTVSTSEIKTLEKLDPTLPIDSRNWACSLFAALGNEMDILFGRNFDWRFSPAVLLFTQPPGKLASVSMVDIAYLGFEPDQIDTLTELPLEDREPLLLAPHLPFDGMNEAGLAIGMAAVPSGNMTNEPGKRTIDSLEVIRQVLDNAATIEQAITIMSSYNIDYGNGPALHYLIADNSGEAVLVEFHQGRMHLIRNENPWLSATNFLVSSVDNPSGQCWRYDKISQEMMKSEGILSQRLPMELLSSVSQPNTQWSIIYHMTTGKIEVAMGGMYYRPFEFNLNH